MANHGNAWQYSRWVYVIGRSLLINPAVGAEVAAVDAFITAIVGTRPWLDLVIKAQDEEWTGAKQSSHGNAKRIVKIGRDLKKIPMTDVEKALCDTFIAATGKRYLGVKGNTI